MGYALCFSACLRCRQIFPYNPTRVPTIRVNEYGCPDPNGTKEPLCEPCFTLLNAIRVEHGLEPWTLPEGAYEACPEEEL
jgi:hypothetical protein